MTSRTFLCLLVLWGSLASTAHATSGSAFTVGTAVARKFGTHEVELIGDGGVSNPFLTEAKVTFTAPSGRAVTVDAFHDGGNSWKARAYVTEPGLWRWASRCATDSRLNGKSGTFTAVDSQLRGMLRAHHSNPRALMTDDGRWFAHISDTAYLLFHGRDAPMWQQFVHDAAGKGVTALRVAALGGWGGTPGAAVDHNDTWVWNDPWEGGAKPDHERFDLTKFQASESRLRWLLETYPDVQVQMILFSFKKYRSEDTGKWWASLPPSARARTMRYMIARWSAFPNVFWLIVNDMHSDRQFPANQAFVREVGRFFAAHDPWRHLISTGPARRTGFSFTTPEDLEWVSYIHLEEADAVGADHIQKHGLDAFPLHVHMGEDLYEHYRLRYKDARFFFRWLVWSWLLSGASANYGGRYGVIHPYSQTWRKDLTWIDQNKNDYTGQQLTGLDSIPFVWPYFRDRGIDLAYFQPDDGLARDADGRSGQLRPKLMRRGTDEILIYHPNASTSGEAAMVDGDKTARVHVDLTAFAGSLQAEWYRAYDGVAKSAGTVSGGAERAFTAPWPGQDVVLRLTRTK